MTKKLRNAPSARAGQAEQVLSDPAGYFKTARAATLREVQKSKGVRWVTRAQNSSDSKKQST